VHNVRPERTKRANVRTQAAPIVAASRLQHDSGLGLRAATRNPVDDLAADAEHSHVDLRIECRNEVRKA
jgi:hypothetical protein